MTYRRSAYLNRIVIRSPRYFELRIQIFMSFCRNRRKEAFSWPSFGGCASVEFRMWPNRGNADEERPIRGHGLVEESNCIVSDHVCGVHSRIMLRRVLVPLRRRVEVDVCVWIEQDW